MHASISVEAPARAAAALATLMQGRAVRLAAASAFVTFGQDARIEILRRLQPLPAPVSLPVRSDLSVEQVIETACAVGCHAEEIRPGVLEFWVDECVALDVFTPEAGRDGGSLRWAA